MSNFFDKSPHDTTILTATSSMLRHYALGYAKEAQALMAETRYLDDQDVFAKVQVGTCCKLAADAIDKAVQEILHDEVR